jgi:hypothetical protein
MPEYRSRLVRAFRAIGKQNKPRSLRIPIRELIRETETQIGTIPIDDCHSLLVAISKMTKEPIKSSLKDFQTRSEPQGGELPHPVVIAPLASQLVRRIISSDAPFRTIAGTFGLVKRLGIDWSHHLVAKERKEFMAFVEAQFPLIIESHLQGHVSLDLAALGYCCEAALELNISSPDFQHYVESAVTYWSGTFPPLALVQILRYLSLCSAVDESIIQRLLDQVALHPDTFTAQNLVLVLQSMTATNTRDLNLLDSICLRLSENVAKMRMSDCVSAVQSIAHLADNDMNHLPHLLRSIQRRCTLLTVTSTTPLPVSTAYTIMSSLNKLAMITGRSTQNATLQFNLQSKIFLDA